MSIGLTLAAGSAFTAGTRGAFATAGVVAAAITLAAGTTLTSAGVIAAAITFATGSAFAARTVLTSTGVIATTITLASRPRAAFATSGAARSRTTFASSMVAVMPAMPFEGLTVLGGQGREFRCVEHAVAVLVILGEQIGGGVGLVVAFSFGCALRMGGGGQREAAEEDRECFVHVTCGLGVYGGRVSRLPSQDKRRPERHRP